MAVTQLMSTNSLSPAERTRRALEQAERAAFVADWKQYRELEDRYRDERFPPKKITHGITGYGYHKCRCDICRTAVREYRRKRRAEIRAQEPEKEKESPGRAGRVLKAEHHGKTTGYAYGCRCRPCKDAHKASNRGWKHGTEYTYNYHKCRCRKCTVAASHARSERQRREDENPAIRRYKRRTIPIPHGTEQGYTHHLCRCRACKDAHNEKVRAHRAQRKKYFQDNPDRIPTKAHGTESGYNTYSCRCRACKDAHAEYTRKRREAKK